LPASAQVMISRIHGEKEIRISVSSANPDAINAPSSYHASLTYDKAAQVYVLTAKHINNCLPGIGLRHGMLLLVGFYREPDFVGTAACGRTRGGSLVLGEERRSEKKDT
jgi:hypothetical protein